MTNLTQQPVVVEQTDHEVAEVLMNTLGSEKVGPLDLHHFLKAFARHRLAERDRCAIIAEAYGAEMRGKRERSHDTSERVALEGHAYAGTNIATAIRSGKEPEA